MDINLDYTNSSTVLLDADKIAGNLYSPIDFLYSNSETPGYLDTANQHKNNIDIEKNLDDAQNVKESVNDFMDINDEEKVLEFISESKNGFTLESELSNFFDMETAIINTSLPLNTEEPQEIVVNGERGILMNKHEISAWKGIIPILEYPINHDPSPELITKKSNQKIDLIQEIAIRYLRPPTPPNPGDIIINQLSDILTPPAPPIIIRQQPFRPLTPEPLVIREAPPSLPPQIGKKIITISGKKLPPPPRKVIIERLPFLPTKPQAVLIERWLPYAEVKRRVIFNKSNQSDPIIVKPKNVIIQWESPTVNIKKEFKYLGVIKADPTEYVKRYSRNLIDSNHLPQFVLDIKAPEGLVLAAEHKYNDFHELEGDVQALKFVNLENEGLSQYRSYLNKLGVFGDINIPEDNIKINQYITNNSTNFYQSNTYSVNLTLSTNPPVTDNTLNESLLQDIFKSIDYTNIGKVLVDDTKRYTLILINKLGKYYDEDELLAFFKAFDTNNDDYLEYEEFKNAYTTLSSLI